MQPATTKHHHFRPARRSRQIERAWHVEGYARDGKPVQWQLVAATRADAELASGLATIRRVIDLGPARRAFSGEAA